MKGFFQDKDGNYSMVRLLTFISHIGAAIGLVVSIFMKSTQGIVACVAVITGGEVAKVVQKKIES